MESELIDQKTYQEMENLLRGEDVMLGRQIQALERKMDEEGTRPLKERAEKDLKGRIRGEKGFEEALKEMGLKRLEDGRYVKE